MINNFSVSKKFFSIFLLIFLAGFLILPKFILAENSEDITISEIKKYLPLPAHEVEDLIYSLIDFFNSQWTQSFGLTTAEEETVSIIMRGAARVKALNYLLIDAPVEVTWKIINTSLKIASVFGIQDISGILEELEKESVQRAIKYGMSKLFENEIRITPGAIKFKYDLQKGGIRETIFQYIVIHKPIDKERGKLVIRFYSTEYLEPPKNKVSYGGMTGYYTELTHDLPPFIVDIQGEVENYKWVSMPSIKIEFPETVPDLGIKPLSFWKRNFLNPIKTALKEVEVIITKITGVSPKIVETISNLPQFFSNIWSEIKSAISSSPFGAQVTQVIPSSPAQPPLAAEQPAEIEETKIEIPEKGIGGLEPLSPLEEIQEQLDDISERIDILSQKIAELVAKSELVVKEEPEKIAELEEEIEKEIEEEIELAKAKLESEPEPGLCEKITGSQPQRNKIILNEIAWMGTVNSANDEWIELKNIFGREIDLTNWQLINKDQKIKIIFRGRRASPNGFLLLERTDDETVPNIPADKIYQGALGNNNEGIFLFDENCILQDEVFATPDWPAGDNLTKRTMERKLDFGWQTSFNIGGTPKRENSSGLIQLVGGGVSPSSPSPEEPLTQINLTFPQENPVNKEVVVQLSIANLKNALYDVKISIEKDGVLSEIYNEKEGKWQSSFNYLGEVFSGNAYQGKFKLKIREDKYDFRDEADILVRVREGGKTKYFESIGKIKIIDQQLEKPQPTEQFFPAVAINEIAWMGTIASPNDEWIELYNFGTTTIDLTGWQLSFLPAGATTTRIISTFDLAQGASTILALDYFLLERTNDETVKDILADQIFTGALNDDGGILELRDGAGNLIDSVDCQKDEAGKCLGWFAGKKENRVSMERINPRTAGTTSANWADNTGVVRNGIDAKDNPIDGTPKSQNSVYQSLPPDSISDLRIDETQSKNNTIILTWSIPEDPDTKKENLSYKVFYTREGEISENNLEAASTLSATTSTISITIPVLFYNSTYYFGVKAFDGKNYSPLSNIVSFSIPSALLNSPWPAFRGNLQRNSQSNYSGPIATPTVQWIYAKDSSFQNSFNNPFYTSPIIDPGGIIYSSVIAPDFKKGILALNSDGEKSWFGKENINLPLRLVENGSVLPDQKSLIDKEGNVYFTEGNILKAIDKEGGEIWQKEFEFEDLKNFPESEFSFSLLPPVISPQGNIYLTAEGKIFGSESKEFFYLYIISSEGNILTTHTVPDGYRESSPAVSSSGTAYIFYLVFPKYAWQPILYLKAISLSGETVFIKTFDLYNPQPPIIDVSGNIYFALGKRIYALNSAGSELWDIALLETPPDWPGEIGMALGQNNALYLSGLGAILSLK